MTNAEVLSSDSRAARHSIRMTLLTGPSPERMPLAAPPRPAPSLSLLLPRTETSCREQGMVNLVVRRCSQPSCTKVPCYGMQGQRAERCVEHKTEGMVNVASRRCRVPGCMRLAHYNYSEQKSKLTCMEHKVSDLAPKAAARSSSPWHGGKGSGRGWSLPVPGAPTCLGRCPSWQCVCAFPPG